MDDLFREDLENTRKRIKRLNNANISCQNNVAEEGALKVQASVKDVDISRTSHILDESLTMTQAEKLTILEGLGNSYFANEVNTGSDFMLVEEKASPECGGFLENELNEAEKESENSHLKIVM